MHASDMDIKWKAHWFSENCNSKRHTCYFVSP